MEPRVGLDEYKANFSGVWRNLTSLNLFEFEQRKRYGRRISFLFLLFSFALIDQVLIDINKRPLLPLGNAFKTIKPNITTFPYTTSIQLKNLSFPLKCPKIRVTPNFAISQISTQNYNFIIKKVIYMPTKLN